MRLETLWVDEFSSCSPLMEMMSSVSMLRAEQLDDCWVDLLVALWVVK